LDVSVQVFLVDPDWWAGKMGKCSARDESHHLGLAEVEHVSDLLDCEKAAGWRVAEVDLLVALHNRLGYPVFSFDGIADTLQFSRLAPILDGLAALSGHDGDLLEGHGPVDQHEALLGL
jgi:hypothetical protein